MAKHRLPPSGPFQVALDSAYGSAGTGGAYSGDPGVLQRLTQTELDVTVAGGTIVIIAGLQQTPSGADPITVALGYQRQGDGINPWQVAPELGIDEELPFAMGSFSKLAPGDYKVAVFAASDTNWTLDQFNILALVG